MEVQCECGRVLSLSVAPGTVVECPDCGRRVCAALAPPRAALLSDAALVLGIVSGVFGFVTGVPAAILGARALGEIRRGRASMNGLRYARAGFILGIVCSLFGFTSLVVFWDLIGISQAEKFLWERLELSATLWEMVFG